VSDTFCSIVIGDPTSRGLLVIGGDERAQPEPNQFTLRYDAGVMTDTGEDMIYGRFYPTATTLWDGRILVQAGRESLANPVTVSEIYEAGEGWRLLPGTDDVDLTQDPPVITEVSPPHFARHWADSVVLLDSRVLITGGSAGMLMLDGSVFVGVCRCLSVFVGVCRCLSVFVGSSGPAIHKSAEMFYPRYLFDGDGAPAERPRRTAVPRNITHGESFTAAVTGGDIDRVMLIKSGGVTHSMNQQIFIELGFEQSGSVVTIDARELATVATPGEYFLYALSNGVPSIAAIVSVGGETGPNVINEELVNGGFERPSVEAAAASANVQQAEAFGWSTNDSYGGLEIIGSGSRGIAAPEGSQYLELNGDEGGSLWQDVSTEPGVTYEWSFWHRGLLDDDTIELLAGPPTASVAVVATATTSPGDWARYNGTYVVPDGQTITRVQLRASDGDDQGNLVDNVLFLSSAPSPPTSPRPPLLASGTAGYWMLEENGTVYSFGGASGYGGTEVGESVALVASPKSEGYWILGADGQVHARGDVAFHGDLSTSPVALDDGELATTMAATPGGDGYWIFTNR
jgi:hypothetical protein